ncbi:MAG TPA: T9SS type A sorting domain-containing protein, partial [Chitinophagaceae bacterium]|nr:T9SS type A sorting domain-containing protein [Chitinophagaceae bacterium]
SPLPVLLSYFNAKRTNSSNVSLTWQTSQEINSKGFEIQRLVGAGGWQVVGFVPSQGLYGNSSSPLTYTFNDANSAHAVTQYRLREVDIDANSKFSEIRAVRGDGQAGRIIVYPNPSSDGTVRIVFEEINGTRDVSLNDASGRVIKQWNGVTNNNLAIDNLTPGFYSLRVIIRETGEQSIEKIVVNKR